MNKEEKLVKIEKYSVCSVCKAITVVINGENYAVSGKNVKKYFPDINLDEYDQTDDTTGCIHCEANLGVDLCGCGSGKPFNHCCHNLRECEYPMQEIGEYTFIIPG